MNKGGEDGRVEHRERTGEKNKGGEVWEGRRAEKREVRWEEEAVEMKSINQECWKGGAKQIPTGE